MTLLQRQHRVVCGPTVLKATGLPDKENQTHFTHKCKDSNTSTQMVLPLKIRAIWITRGMNVKHMYVFNVKGISLEM